MAARVGSAPRERRELVKVVWQLDGERTGTVVAWWRTADTRLVYRKFALERSADWAELPPRVASIAHQGDDRHGQWASGRTRPVRGA